MLEIKSLRDKRKVADEIRVSAYDPLKRSSVQYLLEVEPRATGIFSAHCCITRLRSRPPTPGDFYYSLTFCARDPSEHAEAGAAACVSLGKTRLPFLRRKNVGIIYDLASGGTYTRTRAWEWTARAPRNGSGLIPAAI